MSHSKKSALQRLFKYFLVALYTCKLPADPPKENPEKIDVHLLEPTYCDGVLRTEKGGVISAEDLRIQAKQIVYTKQKEAHTVVAEGELLIDCGMYTFVGDRLEYDIGERVGVIYNGRTAKEPWFFGGEEIYLLADGSYLIHNAFLTTSENYEFDWRINAERATLTKDLYLSAQRVKFKFLHFHSISIPSIRANLDTIFDLPVRFSVKWGGQQGSRFGVKYGLISWRNWKSFLRLDYRVKRGFGGGIELYYHSDDKIETFESINYIARDSTITAPGERTRYRFQGIYNNVIYNDTVDVTLTYDKLSDPDMATDYNDRGLELDTAGRTQLLLHKQHDEWVGNFISRARVNTFQTLKQELPTLQTATIPLSFFDDKVVWENTSQASYLDFIYQNGLPNVHDYNSTRLNLYQKLYRPFRSSDGWVVTPSVGGRALFYGNTGIPHRPQTGTARWAASACLQCDLTKRFARRFGDVKHVIRPYSSYQYWTLATTSANDHYIFDIDDGLTRLNQWKIGFENSLYRKGYEGVVERFFNLDIYTYLFFDTPEIGVVLPKVYATGTFRTLGILRHTLDTAWDFQHGILDHINFRTEWTINANLAFAGEYRHRDIWAWRKADYTNFFLDSFRPEKELLRSSLSDRRDTLLLHCFYRFHPCYALEFESRTGWNRRFEPSYNEFEVDLLATLRSAWNVKLGYERKEYGGVEHRFTVGVALGLHRPDKPYAAPPPFFEY